MKSSNCVICGKEFDISELNQIFVKSSFVACNYCTVESDYEEVKRIVPGYVKFAQQTFSDPQLQSPQILIEPMESNIQKAVDLLKQINPSYFVGVRKIVVDNGSSAFGYVASGGNNNDPATIHINLQKIKSEIDNKLQNTSLEMKNKELIRQIALTMSHEKGHISSFKEKEGFVGGENPAENEENIMLSKIDNYYNNSKD